MNGGFLQSTAWEQIQQNMGRKTWRLSDILVIRHDIAQGSNYLYCPRPLFNTRSLKDFLTEVAFHARLERSLFLKIDPIEPLSFNDGSIRMVPSESLQPQKTVILDLLKSEDVLLAEMHEKTRYNIHLAERKGVEVATMVNRELKKDMEVFWNILSATAERKKFHLHKQAHYEILMNARTNDFSNEFFFAHASTHTGAEVLAAAMINFYHKDTPSSHLSSATYLHGASSHTQKELMAPHLLHWRIIQEAKRRGFYFYDFWGIDEARWPGFTRFKLGFGGKVVEYPHAVDVVYRPFWYHMYRFMKKRTQ